MLAYRVVAPDRVEMVETAAPEPQLGEVLLRTLAVGLCHSDLFIRRAMPALGMELPVTLGHEIVGVVEQLGPGVTHLMQGQVVAVYVLMGCGACRACQRGEDHLCRKGYRGMGTHRDGGLAELVVVPAANTVDATGIDPVAAAPLTDAGLTAYHSAAMALAAAPHARTALVIGVGGLGHLAVQVLAAKELEVLAVDMEPDKAELAMRLGATHGIVSGPDAVAQVQQAVGGREVDVVLDFVGVQATLDLAQQVTHRGSSIAIAGLGGGVLGVQALSVTPLAPEITVRRVSAGGRRELEEVIALGREGRLQAETTTFDFEEVTEALALLEAGKVLGRAVIDVTQANRTSEGD